VIIRRSLLLVVVGPLLLFTAGLAVGHLAAYFAMKATPEPTTLLEAVKIGANDAIYHFVSSGEDPGRAVVLKRRWRHLKAGDQLSPLLVGVVRGDVEENAFLLKHTKLLATPPNDQLLCFVARYNRGNLIDMLFAMGFARTPVKGCDGQGKQPEQVAIESRNSDVARRLRAYRLKFPVLDQRGAEFPASESISDDTRR
jgi:hypothetical protein